MSNPTVKGNSTSAGKWIALLLAFCLMFLTQFITPPDGLSQAGLRVLGILVGAIVLFLSWGTGWPSMAIVFALMTVPGVKAAQVTQATFGNATIVFMIFCMMLAACLTKSGVARRVAVWFLTNKLARKSPWWTVVMFITANYILNSFLSAAATVFIMLPIAIEILESVGLKKEEHAPISVVMMLGLIVAALSANASNPISHATTLQGFNLYQSFTGEPMDFFIYVAIATPVSIATCVLFYLVVKFIWRPDVSPLKKIDYDALAATVGPQTKKEKISVVFYAACVVLWLMPGLSKYIWPAAVGFFGKINNCLPPLAALFLMNFIKADGEPVLDWNVALKSVNWSTVMFICSVMGLGTFMGNQDIGVPAWMSSVLSPVFSNVSPLVFLVAMVFLAELITNFTSNVVTINLVMAIGMPLALGVYDGAVSPLLTCIFITLASNNGWTTAPANPCTAVIYGYGWVDDKSMLKYGLLTALLHVIITMTLGSALGGMLGIPV